MADFDYDVVIIGSGFGGSVAALRAAEKGYRVGIMEAGKRWDDKNIPRNNWELKDYVWFPAAEMYGIQRIEYLDDVLILCGAGVGGGSHVYGNTLYIPPKRSSMHRGGRESPIGPTNWRRAMTKPGGCSVSSAIHICPRTSIGICSKSPTRWAEGIRSTRRLCVCTSDGRASKLMIRISAESAPGARGVSPAATARSAVATTRRTKRRRITSISPRSSVSRSMNYMKYMISCLSMAADSRCTRVIRDGRSEQRICSIARTRLSR